MSDRIVGVNHHEPAPFPFFLNPPLDERKIGSFLGFEQFRKLSILRFWGNLEIRRELRDEMGMEGVLRAKDWREYDRERWKRGLGRNEDEKPHLKAVLTKPSRVGSDGFGRLNLTYRLIMGNFEKSPKIVEKLEKIS